MAEEFSIHFNDAALRLLLEGSEGPVARDLIRRAIRVESQAKLNASGRPGPRVQTGRLRSSITWRLGRDFLGLFADIGSNVVYAKRIEQGFHGTDSLGRRYNQPAFPYLKPALIAARD